MRYKKYAQLHKQGEQFIVTFFFSQDKDCSLVLFRSI
jgi:hypothetical protein